MFQEKPYSYLPSKTKWAQHVNCQRRRHNRLETEEQGRLSGPSGSDTKPSRYESEMERAHKRSVSNLNLGNPRRRRVPYTLPISTFHGKGENNSGFSSAFTSLSPNEPTPLTRHLKPSHLNLVPAAPSRTSPPFQRAQSSTDRPSSVPFPYLGHRRTLLLLPT